MGKKDFSYSDALFLAASAFSDTGLSSVNISEHFNALGQAIIAIGILIGGFGFFTLKLYFFNLVIRHFGWKSTNHDVSLTQFERGTAVIGDTKRLVKVSVTTLFITIIISSIVLFLYFYFSNDGFYDDKAWVQDWKAHHKFDRVSSFDPIVSGKFDPKGNIEMSLRYAVFHSISAVNNAGLDILGGKSLQVYYTGYGIQIILLILFIIGGVGFPTIYDIYLKLESLATKKRYRITLFTKLNITTWLIISVVAIALTFALETTASSRMAFWKQEQYGSTANKSLAIFFNTMATRSAGFSTIDFYVLTQPTLVLHGILMFIGFAPSSTAGGVSNITIAILFLSIFSVIRGRKNIVTFRRQIGKETLIKAINVFVIGLVLVFIGMLVVTTSANGLTNESWKDYDGSQKKFNFVLVFFETLSAFGSSGISTGLSANLNIYSKITLILLMFIGRIGISSTILIWGRQKHYSSRIQYIYEDISIG
ncbi:potassium transporter TrkG [Mycoplasma sp. 128]